VATPWKLPASAVNAVDQNDSKKEVLGVLLIRSDAKMGITNYVLRW